MLNVIDPVTPWQAQDTRAPRPAVELDSLQVVAADVAAVCRRIPPLWDLSNYVAVNPFLGFSATPVVDAARTVQAGLDAQILPGVTFYRERWQAGAFDQSDLERAAQRDGLDPALLTAILDGTAAMPLRTAEPVLTLAEQHDQRHGTAWNDLICRHTALWCTTHVPQETARRSSSHAARSLYVAWREAAQADRSLEIAGLRGWRSWVAALPTQPLDAISSLLTQIPVAPAERHEYLYRLISGVFGWASLLRRTPWEAGSDEPGELLDLLAIRLAGDVAVAHLAPHAERNSATSQHTSAQLLPKTAEAGANDSAVAVEEETIRYAFQEALENGYARRLFTSIAAPQTERAYTRPAVQAVFCIDVRSEPLRRHLEAQNPAIETRGFAGFFGVSLEWQADGISSARCPVLLKPSVQVAAQAIVLANPNIAKELPIAPAAAFTFVEAAGVAYGVGLARDALTLSAAPTSTEGQVTFALEPAEPNRGIALEGRIELATGILKNMGLRETFGRVVLLCGHESHSANNPHAAGLDCGACGGHGGAINARVAAAVLNDPTVRAALPNQGWNVPADTWFLPAVHDTSSDHVTLLDTEAVPASHRPDLDDLRHWLDQAGALVRAERATALGLESKPVGLLDRLLKRRARDWSEVRPEWALARNAAFIAARRERTRTVNLEGRSFLHEYDWTTDPDNSILTLILTAPMVVASWINLQYFASTVDNKTFGCGTKTLHNRVGALGVVLGNGGDLRTGLALQSVQAPDGRWFHEPLRLQVLVEAPRERIEAVLAAHPDVRDLVANGWVRLFALHPENSTAARWTATGWEDA